MTRLPGSPAITPSIRTGSTRSSRRERSGVMHLTQNWEIRKPGASSRGGIVASQSRTAATVGAEVLAAGGTAVDAAVATALALAAVEPWNSGLGGIGFMVVHRAGADHAEAVDFGPVAPRGLDPGAYPLTGATKTELFTWPQVEGDRNIHGPLAFAIPSAVRGYAAAVERFGRMPWRELVAPAAALARAGAAGRLVHHGQGCRCRGRSAALRRKPAGVAAGRPAAGLSARPRPYRTCRSAASPIRWSGSPPPARRISTTAISRIRLPPICARRVASCRPGRSRRLSRADRAGARYPLSRRHLAGGAGNDRRPDPGLCSRTARPAAFRRRSGRRLFRGGRRGVARGLCRPARPCRRCRDRRADLDHRTSPRSTAKAPSSR